MGHSRARRRGDRSSRQSRARRICFALVLAGICSAAQGCRHEEAPRSSEVPDATSLARLCFSREAVQAAAGESFSAADSASELRRHVVAAVTPTVRSQLRRAKQLVPASKEADLGRVVTAARQGISELGENPALLRSGRVPGFKRAQDLSKGAGLMDCSSAGSPVDESPRDSRPSPPSHSDSRKAIGRVFECSRKLPHNDLRVSGGASCADAAMLFMHPLRNKQTFRGWHCNQESLGRYGPVLNFCAHGRNLRVSYVFKG
jgi:hypothetical protein